MTPLICGLCEEGNDDKSGPSGACRKQNLAQGVGNQSPRAGKVLIRKPFSCLLRALTHISRPSIYGHARTRYASTRNGLGWSCRMISTCSGLLKRVSKHLCQRIGSHARPWTLTRFTTSISPRVGHCRLRTTQCVLW